MPEETALLMSQVDAKEEEIHRKLESQDHEEDWKPEYDDFAQVEVEATDHPELYDIEKEAKEFDDAVEELDNTWDDAEAQIKWWQTVPVGWPNFVGTWHNTWGEATDDTDKWNEHGDLVVRADGTWNSRTDNDGTAWWDGRHRVNFKRGKDDSDDCIGTFVDGYLRVER